MTRHDVIRAWLQGGNARAHNLSCRAGKLYSYALCIGVLQIGFHATLRTGAPSPITRRHINLARRAAQANGLTIGDME